MKIHIKKMGALDQAEFQLGELTIICGRNNTGKTYATYALFGFLSFWREVFTIRISDASISSLMSEGVTTLNVDDYVQESAKILHDGCVSYTKQLPMVFAAPKERFSESEFMVSIEQMDIRPADTFERRMGAAESDIFSISKTVGSSDVVVSLLVEKDKLRVPREIISRVIGDAIKDIVFGHLFPKPFIASAERTGAAIFRKELNFARNRLLEQMSQSDRDINPLELLVKVYDDYALPVKTNVDFTRQLETLAKKNSFIFQNHLEVLNDFSDIIGGEYLVTKNDELFYVPKGKRVRLTMDESSSAVRSLLDIGFYLRHVAQPGDMLMVDEPELNLHPENQRRIARLLARLVNLGIKVFITTHSDYIIKELNTLIMLNRDKKHHKEIMKEEGYRKEELLAAEKVRVYIAQENLVCKNGKSRRSRCLTFERADIDPELGIEAPSFDDTIDNMNRIQEAIMFGEENA